MEQRRKAERITTRIQVMLEPLESKGKEDSFFVQVVDVSKDGIGFLTEQNIADHSFYRAHLVLESKESVDTIIETVRHVNKNETGQVMYGGRFVGLSESDRFKIEVFRLFAENERNRTQ